jgi:hypothetical protein
MTIMRLIGNWQYLARWQYLEHLPILGAIKVACNFIIVLDTKSSIKMGNFSASLKKSLGTKFLEENF